MDQYVVKFAAFVVIWGFLSLWFNRKQLYKSPPDTVVPPGTKYIMVARLTYKPKYEKVCKVLPFKRTQTKESKNDE
jgi:hypothetical protein